MPSKSTIWTKMEVCVEDFLHIRVVYKEAKEYDLRGVIVGKLYVPLLRIKIKLTVIFRLRKGGWAVPNE